MWNKILTLFNSSTAEKADVQIHYAHCPLRSVLASLTDSKLIGVLCLQGGHEHLMGCPPRHELAFT